MPITYDNIATTTLSSAAATITFSSIPATYTDLRLVFIGTASASTNGYIRFNSDSGTNYSRTSLTGDGSGVYAQRATNVTFVTMTVNNAINTTIPTLRTADIFSYAGSTNKTVLTTEASDLNGSGGSVVVVQLWRNTSAINQIELSTTGGANYSAGTTVTLYGIKNA
jgi:hypothetical protein